MNLVEFRNISLVFERKKTVLEEVTLSIPDNKIVTIIGPNGGGKSSLIKLILGIYKPTAGTLKVKKGLRIGYMPQKIEVSTLMPLPVGRFLKSVESLKIVKAQELVNQDMSTLSGGQMQRVLLAYALQDEPEILLLDEPAQGLDVAGEEMLYRLILEYQKRTKCAVVLISHDLNFVLKQTEHVVCLNRHMCCEGSPEKVSKSPIYQNMFGKVPYVHHHDHEHDLEGGVCELHG